MPYLCIMNEQRGPTREKERYVILDALRGVALAGIALANFPEFGLWTFLSPDEQSAMPTGNIDITVRFLEYLLVDGKFYTIFSVLFGIGFSLILFRHSTRVFIRRMLVLALIGFCHLMFIWSGDILLLYASGGLLLTLFFHWSDKTLLWVAATLMVIPVGLDAITEYGGIDFARPFYESWWSVAASHGITEANFATWLRDADSYPQMFAFLLQGAVERMWEFVGGHRLPKVLGLFIIGSLIGKHRLYARLDELHLRRTAFLLLAIGLPSSMVYAWSATHGHPWGLTLHSLLYTVSVTSLSFGYITSFCFLFTLCPNCRVFRMLAAPGRMALTCYLSHSVCGIIIFYGIGFGLGTSMGLTYIELIALAVFALQIVLCRAWLRYFLFGPMEWLWRMLTYGRRFPIWRK